MTKKLRITIIIAVILLTVLSVPVNFVVISKMRAATTFTEFLMKVAFFFMPDREVMQFLHTPGAIEEFKRAKGEKSARSESQVPPLVKQAKAFGLYLNPPPAPRPERTARKPRKPTVTPRPRTVSAKFTLVGTSYYASHPGLSLALIDEPGKDLRWVRQSGEVGHLIIEQIKNGLVVVRDGKMTFELVAERPKKRSLLKGPPSGKTGSESTLSASGKTDSKAEPILTPSGKRGDRITEGSPPPPPPQTSDEEDVFDELLGKLKALQSGGESDQGDSAHDDEENEALMEKLISELKAMRISAKEAKRLDHLGKELKDVERDSNQAKDRRVGGEAGPREPNSPAKK